MKTRNRTSLLKVLGPVAALAVGAAAPAIAPAQAVNPCAPAATAPANPCAPAPMNPCAPAAAPSKAANPCAPAAANPCAPAAAPAEAATELPKGPYDTTVKFPQAPYGNQMPDIVQNYLRATPYVGTGGNIDATGIPLLKSLGFKTVVDLNLDDEGAAVQGPMIEKAGLAFIHVPVPTKAPTPEQVAEFAKIVENPANYPILVHCESANRVGAMWALYRASKGVPAEVAVEEGRAIGLKTSREPAVREQLGMPPL